ncbi:MAG: ligase-associated DNA damage response DEXH box helicase [Fimbriimonadaceae bacterium]|nr:ligase-associated DNA damage response DEXH box helicase [Chitinophagales bacterium]
MLRDEIVQQWFLKKKWKAYPFQLALAQAYFEGYSGLLNAPTGSGKTYAMWIPIIADAIQNTKPETQSLKKIETKKTLITTNDSQLTKHDSPLTTHHSLKVLWITPLRALAKDIKNALQEACDMMQLKWTVELRTGDISAAQKQRQKKEMPDCLIITPESLHVLLCGRNYSELFQNLECIVVDEWHELLGSKRGVQVELAISHLKNITHHPLRIWGISATIGNLVEALEVLVGNEPDLPQDDKEKKITIVRSETKKEIQVNTVLPETIDVLPWAGHIGLKLLPQIADIINRSTTTLVFTNTRAMAEIWYHHILNYNEDLAGLIAMHHGSLSAEVRDWVEENLHAGNLKAVICTSSLDLGVDFRPVDTVIQIGSPKGVARFTQRAGRSGHQPGAISKIYFIPTHALELVEISAIKEAIKKGIVEKREPQIMCFDVLLQYLVSLSIGEGFISEKIYKEIKSTHAYYLMNEDEWNWILQFITEGGSAFSAYDEFSKVAKVDGKYRIMNNKAATKHRLQIGTIVSDPVVRIAYLRGGSLGTVEEYFIASLKPGDVFWFAGMCLEFIMLKDMTAYVKKTKEQRAATASYMGGRMPLSSYMAELMRIQLERVSKEKIDTEEYNLLDPLLTLQKQRSIIPTTKQLLVETSESKDGFHIFIYPFEGRVVHEVMSGLAAYRLSKIKPVSISTAMNDYGFELLCNEKIDINEDMIRNIFDTNEMESDLFNSVNATEMARRKFRDISIISGMVFTGYPGELKRSRHLQSSSQLLFDVLKEYEPKNLLLKQAYDEILHGQMENARMRTAFLRILKSEIVIRQTERFSPFAFPIVVDSLRDKLTSEQLSDRVKKMIAENNPA